MIGVNLISERAQVAQARRRRIQRWVSASGAAALLLVVPLGLDWSTRAKADALRRKRDRAVAAYRATTLEIERAAAAEEDARIHVERAEALSAKRAWSAMLVVIADALPERSWLVTLGTDPSTPPGGSSAARAQTAAATGETTNVLMIEAPRELRLIGYAHDAADPLVLVSNLKRTGVFRHVDLRQSTRETGADGSYFRFELACGW
jgi:Tfp pilus assembly protein PilN